jgi:hypothetical protein
VIEVYWTDTDGIRWRIYDTTFTNRKHHIRAIGDATATSRVFVQQNKQKRSYTFKPSDSRLLDEEALARQLREAAFLADKPFDSSSLRPR